MEWGRKRKRNDKKDNIIFSVYTFSMSIFVQPTLASTPKTKNIQRAALFYAAILIVMIVAQLFTFEEFVPLVVSFDFPGGDALAHFDAAFIIVAELLALPFLLRMSVSPAFRWVSMIAGWFVAATWLKFTVWLVVSGSIIHNVGFLGTAVEMTPGWWAIFASIILGILTSWASWGMWPRQNHAKRVMKRRS